jgi:hypothetical protein
LDIQHLYKVNLIEAGRQFVYDGEAFHYKRGKCKKGHFYLFNDLFAIAIGSKLRTITLKNSFLLGKEFSSGW